MIRHCRCPHIRTTKHARISINQSFNGPVVRRRNHTINRSIDEATNQRSFSTTIKRRSLRSNPQDLFHVPNPNQSISQATLPDLRAWLRRVPIIDQPTNQSTNQLPIPIDRPTDQPINQSYLEKRFTDLSLVTHRLLNDFQSQVDYMDYAYIVRHCAMISALDQSINLPNNPSNNQPINHSVNQSVKQKTNESVTATYNSKPTGNQSSSDTAIPSTKQSTNPSTTQSTNQQTNQHTNESTNQSITQKCFDLALSIFALQKSQDWKFSKVKNSFLLDLLQLSSRAGSSNQAITFLISNLIQNRKILFTNLLKEGNKPLTSYEANLVVWAFRNQYINQSINHAMNQSTNPSLIQSINHDYSELIDFLSKVCSGGFDRLPPNQQNDKHIRVGGDFLSMDDPEVRQFVTKSVYQSIRPDDQTLSIILSINFALFDQCINDRIIGPYFKSTINQSTDQLLMNKLFEYYVWKIEQSSELDNQLIDQSASQSINPSIDLLVTHYQSCRRKGVNLNSHSTRILQRYCGPQSVNQSISQSTSSSLAKQSSNQPIHHLVPTGLRFFLQQVAAENQSLNQSVNSLPLDRLLADRSLPANQVLAAYEHALKQSVGQSTNPSRLSNLNAIYACLQLSHWQRALQLLTLPNQSSIEIADVTINHSIDHSMNQPINDSFVDPYADPPSDDSQPIGHSINQSIHQAEKFWSLDYFPALDEWNLPSSDALDFKQILTREFDQSVNQSITQPSFLHYVMTIAAMDAAGNRQSITKADQLHAIVLQNHPWLIDQSINISIEHGYLELRLNSIDQSTDQDIVSLLTSADLDDQSFKQARNLLLIDRSWAILFLCRRLLGRYAAFVASQQSTNQSTNQSTDGSVNIFSQINDQPDLTEAFHSSYLNELCEEKFSDASILPFQPVDDPFNPDEEDRDPSINRCLLTIDNNDESERAVFEALKRTPFRLVNELKTIQTIDQNLISENTDTHQHAASRTLQIPKHLFRCILHKDD